MPSCLVKPETMGTSTRFLSTRKNVLLRHIRFLLHFLVLSQTLFYPLTLTTVYAQNEAGTLVTAKGVGIFEPGREAMGRERALNDAKRLVLEQALGTSVESKTVVENFVLVKDQVVSHASGYLKNFRILREEKSDLGMYEITIEAEVDKSFLVTDLERFGKILSEQKNPRVAIIVDLSMGQEMLPAARKAADLLADRLKSSGFNVFQENSDNKNSMGLTVRIVLERSIRETHFRDMRFAMNEISLSARILRAGDAEILATAAAVASIPGDKSLNILDDGARRCVDNVWNELRGKLVRLWEKERAGQRQIQLVLNNIPSYETAVLLPSSMETDLTNVSQVRLVKYSGKTAEFALGYRGWPEHLATEMQMSYFTRKNFSSNIAEISGYRLVLNTSNHIHANKIPNTVQSSNMDRTTYNPKQKDKGAKKP